VRPSCCPNHVSDDTHSPPCHAYYSQQGASATIICSGFPKRFSHHFKSSRSLLNADAQERGRPSLRSVIDVAKSALAPSAQIDSIMARRGASVPPVSKEQAETDRIRRLARTSKQRLEARVERTMSFITATRNAQEQQQASAVDSSGSQPPTSLSLQVHDDCQRTPTTRVRIRDVAGTRLCLVGELDADPPGSVPAHWTVHRARNSQWGFLHNGKPGDHNGQFTCTGNVSLAEYDFTYKTRVLGKSDILGTLPHGAVVTVVKPNGKPPLGEGPETCPATQETLSHETPPSSPRTPKTPPSLRHRFIR